MNQENSCESNLECKGHLYYHLLGLLRVAERERDDAREALERVHAFSVKLFERNFSRAPRTHRTTTKDTTL